MTCVYCKLKLRDMNPCNFTNRKVSKALEIFTFACLLVITYLFAKSTVKEYFNGRTTFSSSTRPSRVEDLPIASICLKEKKQFDYRNNLVFKAFIPHLSQSVIQLEYGSNNISGQLVQMKKVHTHASLFWLGYCISIKFVYSAEFFSKTVGLLDLRDEFFHIIFLKIHPRHNGTTSGYLGDAKLLLTSQQNSYGLVTNHWYEGNVEPIWLKNGAKQNLRITETRMYEYLKGTCTQTSFYECLAKKLQESDICHVNDNTCAPFSLPGKDFIHDWPLCPVDTVNNCHDNFSKVAFIECRKEKSCFVTEYSLKESSSIDQTSFGTFSTSLNVSESIMEDLLYMANNSYLFRLSYDHWDWQKGDRGIGLKVDVHKEYLVWTGSALIGSVGGLFGMTIGFSFLGFFCWLLDIIPRLFKLVCYNK